MSTKYKIQKPTKDEKMPKSGSMFGAFLPLKDMEVGEFFHCSLGDIARVKQGLHEYGKKNGVAFLLNMEEFGATCWRVS